MLISTSSSMGYEGLSLQHAVHAHPILHVLLNLLFTLCLYHSCVPANLSRIIIVSILKGVNTDEF